MTHWIKRVVSFPKRLIRQHVVALLKGLALWRLSKIKPCTVGVTGSVGKTSTKEALYAVLSSDAPTFRAKGNLNSEFGAFLGILEQSSGYSSVIGWVKSLSGGFWKALTTSRRRPLYRHLVVEMGAFRKGDIAYLARSLKPTIGILTAVKPVHLGEDFFPDLEAIFQEKSELIRALPADGLGLINADDKRVMRLAGKSETVTCPLATFGTAKRADWRATHIQSTLHGLTFTLHHKSQSVPVTLPGVIGAHHIYVALPAIAVGVHLGMTLEAATMAIQQFAPPPGRLNWIDGIKGTRILDSSYNASPEAMEAAVLALGDLRLEKGRKIAALGSMNDLGDRTESAHRAIGKQVSAVADRLITVGKSARYYAEAAHKEGFKSDRIHSFGSSVEAAEFLKPLLKKGDVILAKGSQDGIRMEKLVKALMARPKEASQKLVRQSAYWETH